MLQFSKDKKPVVVWNCTRTCNLKCVHCYAGSEAKQYEGELTTDEAKAMIDDLASFGSPVLLFSGGEPCLRPDLVELMGYAKQAGMRVVISTNGTLITPEKAREYAKVGLSYVGVSLDGGRETHDKFRGVPGSFDRAMEGIRNSKAAGIKVGLRMTIDAGNVQDIDEVFDIMEREGVNRACFYHLVYAGRGTKLMDEDLDHEQTRAAVLKIMKRTREWFDRGGKPEILTVDNHADAVLIYETLLKEDPDRAADVMELLRWNGGNSSGNGIGCISWDGEVYADQFWRHFPFGNVRERPFSEIWTDTRRLEDGGTEQSELMFKLKDKRPWVKGRCATCRWLDICGGNFRVRAEAATGDLWAPDPACYLTDEEIAK
jgi:12,18-didecarboxysiroheme deacetylase